MSAKREALERIAAVGGEFYDWGDERTELLGSAETPAGIVWTATGCHSLAVNFHTDRPAGWRSLLADVRAGTESCTLEDCEYCNSDG